MNTAVETEDVPAGAPTPDEIRAACQEMQATWDDEEYRRRAGALTWDDRPVVIRGTERVAWYPPQTEVERRTQIDDLIDCVLAGLGPRRPGEATGSKKRYRRRLK